MAECCTINNGNKKKINYYIPFLLIPLAILIYVFLERGVDFLVYSVLGLDKIAHLTETIWFFLYETPKVLILLTVIVFVVGIIRSYFSPEKTRKVLEGKPLFIGNIMASTLGIVTPFCSCSAIPLFIGFVESGIPLGVTFSFLDCRADDKRSCSGPAFRTFWLEDSPALCFHRLADSHSGRVGDRQTESRALCRRMGL